MISRFKQNMIMFEVASFLLGKICECAHWKGDHQGRCVHHQCKCKGFRPVKFRRISRGVELICESEAASIG